MEKRTALGLGVLVGGLGVIGLFVQGHLINLMNVDIALDLLRLPVAAALIYSAMKGSLKMVRTVLLVVGVLYLVMGVLALFDRQMFGLLPSGLTGFDIAFHVVTGAAAVWLGMRKGAETPASVKL